MLHWFPTLKFKITALAVVCGVASALASAHFVLETTRRDMQRILLAEQQRERARTAAILGSKLDTLTESLQAVARSSIGPAWDNDDSMQRYLEQHAAAKVLFDNLTAARPDGQVVARTTRSGDTTRPLSITSRAYFHQALRTDQPVVSEPIRSLLRGEPLVVVAASVHDDQGRAVGVIVGGLDIRSTRLFAQLDADDHEIGTRFLVMDREGRVVAHSNPERALGRAEDEPGLRAVVARWKSSGSPIDAEGSAEVSEGYVVSMAGIPASNWALVELMPVHAAMAPAIAAARTGWISALGVGVLAALLAGTMAWWLTQPISQLRSRAVALLAEDAPVQGDWPRLEGELGSLAQAFQRVVEQREQREQQTRLAVRQLEAVFAHVDIGIALTRQGRFEMVSPRFCEIFGLAEAQMLHRPTRICHASDTSHAALATRIGEALDTQGFFEEEVELVRRGSENFWAQLRGRPILEHGTLLGTIWTLQDVTEQRAQREQLEWRSRHDPLTGLANRAAFDVLLAQYMKAAAREGFCALFIDLDRFKQVNDTAGHAAGDALLRDIAAQLVAQVRRSDTVARLGGDEFAVLLPRCPATQARGVAQNLRLAVANYRLHWEGQEHGVGASIGMVVVDGSFEDATAVMRAADAACYAAKHRGRNAVVVHGD